MDERDPKVSLQTDPCTCCQGRQLTVWVVKFYKFEKIELWASPCTPASLQLVRSGLFPCAPVFPSLAVEIRLLDFVRRLFLRIAPNHTAWCQAATDFLGAQGYRLPGEDPLRRRFANALQWFVTLHDQASTKINSILNTARAQIIPSSMANIPAKRSPLFHCERANVAEYNPRTNRASNSGSADSSDREDANTSGCKRARSFDESDDDDDARESEPRSLSRPSEYLRSRCPLCFGGYSTESVVVCVDACFTQKHNAGKEDYVKEWKVYVDSQRASKPQPSPTKRPKKSTNVVEKEDDDCCEDGLRVPKSVLDGCLSSFTAADEARVKGSTQFFDVTAQMALLCRHDRPLWAVNMHTAGEGQHYTLALLASLFEHLPSDVIVRLLYDIGCQLHRSCVKWGFLKPYMSRTTFAISIFHAFGHQWPCQIVYHPRKCIGYGLSDGEGAERLWHALSRLIAYGRVAGVGNLACGHVCVAEVFFRQYYVRIYNLDSQLNFSNEESLFRLGIWLRRKWGSCEEKLKEATESLRDLGETEDVLRAQWTAQVQAQTKPLPRRSKNLGKSAVEEVIRIRKSRDMLTEKVSHLREIIINPSTPTWDVATAELELQTAKESLSKVQAKLASKERALGERQRVQLRTLVKSTYINKRMNALALLTRIRERLRSRKFELDRLERSYRKQRSEQRVNDHTQDSVKRRDPTIASLARKYNQYCVELARLIEQRKATRNAVPPKAIDMDKLFSLDVDDDIWLDIGLGYDNDKTTTMIILLHLCGYRMRKFGRVFELSWIVIVVKRNVEDCLLNEMQCSSGFMKNGRNEYFLPSRNSKGQARRLFVAWERAIVGIPATENLPEWGLSQGEMIRAREEQVFGGGIEQMEDAFDIEFEADADELLTEHLDSLRVTENYKESRRSIEL
ncbi:hypothetical protein DFJ43DRAFT_1162491 [Lentinula guzmanii]|uniref:CxC1-like cysteine cluster associated with KDZ transposases domain-containing protein n=1 Tax=Lentinula guzmanii TaxID=2804957 RepID=A0AA38J6X5_9AGAR|nr:hypothetical protein DFJ43DRAFT_1162491 [Lentinula guzmanii]